jgi:hypothetical protein
MNIFSEQQIKNLEQLIQHRMALSECTVYEKIVHGMFNKETAKTVSFTLPVTEHDLSSGEHDAAFAEEFSRCVLSKHGSTDNDKILIHGMEFETFQDYPLIRIHVCYLFTVTTARKEVLSFLQELNDLQKRYGISISDLMISCKRGHHANHLLMDDKNGRIVFSRVWGG